MVTNCSSEKLIVPKATVLGIAEEMTPEVIDRINAGDKESPSSQNFFQKKKRNESL